jgi:hypothetical protein
MNEEFRSLAESVSIHDDQFVDLWLTEAKGRGEVLTLRIAVELADGVELEQVDVAPGDRMIECVGVSTVSLAVGQNFSAIEIPEDDPRAWGVSKPTHDLYLRSPFDDPNAVQARLVELIGSEPLSTWAALPGVGFAQTSEDFAQMLQDGFGLILSAPEPVVLIVGEALAELGLRMHHYAIDRESHPAFVLDLAEAGFVVARHFTTRIA